MVDQAQHEYIAIDLKSFYASVECVERGLDPLASNLVVADESRTEKTICLAVTPGLKAYGVPGRARLFEVIERVREINAERLRNAPGHRFTGSSSDTAALAADPSLKLDFVIARPQMSLYMKRSTEIYSIYLKYIAPEDMHVYSVDEVFIDVGPYLKMYSSTARDIAMRMIRDVLEQTGITATVGIGTNMYLAKIAMDIVAKKMPADKDGVRIAELDEISYRRLLWNHTPITDFWRVGRGYARRLAEKGLYTMGDIARCSVGKPGDYYNEDLLYKLFGINAELLIDHAWGWEPCTIADIKSYRPERSSLSEGQVLQCPYDNEKAGIVVREMTDKLVLQLIDKGLYTDQMVLTIGYDTENLTKDEIRKNYKGEIHIDWYGRMVPKHAHGTANLGRFTSSARLITEAVNELYERITDPMLLIRRINVAANNVVPEELSDMVSAADSYEQLDLFVDYDTLQKQREEENAALEKEHRLQKAELDIKKRFGINAVLKGTSFLEGATGIERNSQIGGHRA